MSATPLTALSVTDLLARVGSEDPTPGGGSVSALAGALAAALGGMVWRLTAAKAGEPLDHATAALARELAEAGTALEGNVDRDAAAYDGVIAAMRLPKSTDAEKAVRRGAIQAATRVATEVPLETARLCARVMEICLRAAVDGYGGAVTDAGVGVLMAHAGLNGALHNVEINLSGMSDEAFTTAVAAEVAALRAIGRELLAEGEATVGRRIGG